MAILTMLELLVLFLVSVVLIKSISNILFALHVFKWVRTEPTNEKKSDIIAKDHVFFILPVYLEQENILKVLNYYTTLLTPHKNAHLVIVTSKKEDSISEKTTHQIAEHFLLKSAHQNVSLYKYPHDGGYMAHQVNFGFKKSSELIPTNKSWAFLLNIDSLYSKEAIEDVLITCTQDRKRIYQYSTLFVRNFSRFKNNKAFLKAAALFQTRWTIVHEMKRYICNIQNTFWSSFQFAHVVGHGLLIPGEILDRLYLDEDYIVEDSAFGFYLRSLGYKIHPKQIFETGDSPVRIADYYKQKYNWAFGPIGYLLYLAKFKKRFPAQYRENRKQIIGYVIQGLLSSLNWLVSSWIFIFLIISLILLQNPVYTILITLSLILYSTDYLLVYYWLKENKYIPDSNYAGLLTYISLWIIILTHSFPANIAFIHLTLNKLGIKNLRKTKTIHEV